MDKAIHDDNKDWFLGTLNNIVNNNTITIGITIFSHGFIISGHLAGGKEYFDATAGEFSALLNNSGKVENSFIELANRIYESDSDNVKNGPLSTDYIHIKNAKFINSSTNDVLPNDTVWWRGRISEVSGFSIGVINGDSD